MSITPTKWQPKKVASKEANLQKKMYSIRNGKIQNHLYDEIKEKKVARESNKKVYSIKKAEAVIEYENRQRNQDKLWVYKKEVYKKDEPINDEDIIIQDSKEELRENVPKRERSPVAQLAPIKQIEVDDLPPPQPKKEPVRNDVFVPFVAAAPVAFKAVAKVANKATYSFKGEMGYESFNKSMRKYRF